jgi:hypothetical protein
LRSFPAARLLHIVRNPLNVVASMLLGRQVAVPDLHGAINYWCEAVQIAATLRKAAPDRVMDLSYEDLVADVPGPWPGRAEIRRPAAPHGLYSAIDAHPERNLWRDALDPADAATVVARCGALARTHGYDLQACVAFPTPLTFQLTGRITCLSPDDKDKTRAGYFQTSTYRYDVANLNCGGCAARAQSALSAAIPGVETARSTSRHAARRS